MEEVKKPRTSQQNRALHKWFIELSETLNEIGMEQQLTIGTIDVPWTPELVKSMYKKIARAQFDKGHTSELTTKELMQVSETLNRVLADKGIHVDFPSIESLIYKQL